MCWVSHVAPFRVRQALQRSSDPIPVFVSEPGITGKRYDSRRMLPNSAAVGSAQLGTTSLTTLTAITSYAIEL